MAVTIKDVAKKAGVAPSTVSRVIADHPSISQKTKDHVRQVMAELQYYPNFNARQLVNQRSRTVGIVLPPASDAFYQSPFFPTALRGINEAASRQQYSLLLTTGEDTQARLENVKGMIYGKQVEGLIFLYAAEGDPILELAMETSFPFVVIGNVAGLAMNSVDNDNLQIAKEATEYLWQEGARRIGFIGGDQKLQVIQKRIQGVDQALKKHGQNLEPDAIYNDLPFLANAGYDLMQDLIQADLYDGLVISDQLVAEGAYHAVLEQGLVDRYQLITFKAYSDHQAMTYLHYPYFDLHSQQLGDQAMEILLESLQAKEESSSQRYVYELVASDLVRPDRH
ncbi:LacI family DNA-binding transcriptional regulator [Hutsoniella sourekii]